MLGLNMKTLKNQIKEDIRNVLLNPNEFAEVFRVRFPPEEEIEIIGVLSMINDSWRYPRVKPIDNQKEEEIIFTIDADPFKDYIFKQGAEIYINDEKYIMNKIRDNGYLKEFTLRRKEK